MAGIIAKDQHSGRDRGRLAGPPGAHGTRFLAVFALLLGAIGVLAPGAKATQHRLAPLPDRAVRTAGTPLPPTVFAARLWRPGVLTDGGWLKPARVPAVQPAATGSGWRVQPTPDPVVWRNGLLTASSCAGPRACTAVGGYENGAGTEVTLAEIRSGASWRLRVTPNPAGAIWSRLFGVSCTSADACTAAGYYLSRAGQARTLAEFWNGTRWRIRATPNPAANRGSGFFAISCTSARACTAVGDYTSSTGAPVLLAERWNGRNWRLQAIRGPAGATASGLFGVSCVSASACTAAGAYDNGAGVTRTLAERWNGSRWRVQVTPNPAGSAGSGFSAVSCGSAGACTAAGSYGTRSGISVLLAGAWNGKTWRLQATPSPAGSLGSELLAVSCSSPRACTAAGSYVGRARKGLTLAERWNGSRWRVQHTPGPAGSAGSGFSAVSCGSAASCVTAGSYFTAVAGPLTLAGTWNGRNWRIQPTRSPRGAAVFSDLSALSCPSAGDCTAVGTSTNSAGLGVTLAERWNGIRWGIQKTPDPAGSLSAALVGVSCTSPRSCTAVGDYFSGGRDRNLAEHWNGTSWSIQRTPNPPGAAESDMSGVSCTSPSACAAVGFYSGKGGSSKAFTEIWDGTRWRLEPAPSPAARGHLFGVSCTSKSACVAVGDFGSETWNGSAWSFHAIFVPAGSQGVQLSGVSCTSALTCTAVGSYFSSTAGPLTLAETWNGVHWRMQVTPNPVGAERSELSGVSCTSASACTAVGDHATSDFTPPVGFAESWNGTSWSLQTTPAPAGTVSSVLFGVSCVSPDACTAVGYRFGVSGIQLTLAVTTAGR